MDEIFSIDTTVAEGCPFDCLHCGNLFNYKELDESYYEAIIRFADKFNTEIVFEGREPMLRPDRIEHFLKHRNAQYLIVTTGVVNKDKLEKFILDYNVDRLLVSCPGDPDVEKSIRHSGWDFMQRKWVLKYRGTPLYDNFMLNHVVYVDSLRSGKAKENLDWVVKEYPGMHIICSFDIHDNFTDFEALKDFSYHLAELRNKGVRIGFPYRTDKKYSVTASGSDLFILNKFHIKISMKEFAENVEMMGPQIKAIIDSRKEVLGCSFYKKFSKCGGPTYCGEMYKGTYNHCPTLYSMYALVEHYMKEANK